MRPARLTISGLAIDQKRAIAAPAALAQSAPQTCFGSSSRATGGLPAGVIAERLGIQPSSPSYDLAQFVRADLITQRCVSRQLIYSVSGSGVSMTASGQSVPLPLFSLGSAFECVADGRGDASAGVYEYTPYPSKQDGSSPLTPGSSTNRLPESGAASKVGRSRSVAAEVT